MAADRRSESSTKNCLRLLLLCTALAGLLLAPGVAASKGEKPASSRSYDATMAGHPVKVIYYALYPVGYVLNTLILKPAWWLGQREPFRTVFGVSASRSDPSSRG